MAPKSHSSRVWSALDRVKLRLGYQGRHVDLHGDLVGMLTDREAIASGRATVGPHSYGSFTVLVGAGDRARVHIGSYCSIGVGATFGVGGNHRTDWVTTYPLRTAWGLPGANTDGHPRPERDIVVGSDVWIGSDALILPGVSVGDGAVIGARAVVARDVRPYAIVVGSPATEVRRRFDDATVERLLAARWWTWADDRVRAHVDLLCSGDVEGLLTAAESGVTR